MKDFSIVLVVIVLGFICYREGQADVKSHTEVIKIKEGIGFFGKCFEMDKYPETYCAVYR